MDDLAVVSLIPRREWDDHRKIIGLQSALPMSGRPSHIQPLRRKGGSKAKGLTYEKQVGRWLKRQGWDPVSGQWFSFRDSAGYGCAQTDHLLFMPDQVVVVECKLTETWVGFSQIRLPLQAPSQPHLRPSGDRGDGVQALDHEEQPEAKTRTN